MDPEHHPTLLGNDKSHDEVQPSTPVYLGDTFGPELTEAVVFLTAQNWEQNTNRETTSKIYVMGKYSEIKK